VLIGKVGPGTQVSGQLIGTYCGIRARRYTLKETFHRR